MASQLDATTATTSKLVEPCYLNDLPPELFLEVMKIVGGTSALALYNFTTACRPAYALWTSSRGIPLARHLLSADAIIAKTAEHKAYLSQRLRTKKWRRRALRYLNRLAEPEIELYRVSDWYFLYQSQNTRNEGQVKPDQTRREGWHLYEDIVPAYQRVMYMIAHLRLLSSGTKSGVHRTRVLQLLTQYADTPGAVSAFAEPYLQDLEFDELRAMRDILLAVADAESIGRDKESFRLESCNKVSRVFSMQTPRGTGWPAYLLANRVEDMLKESLRAELLAYCRKLRGVLEGFPGN